MPTKKASTKPDYDPSGSGIREVSILPRRKLPVGYVAYCHPCNWSTRIIIGNTDDMSGWHRADVLLSNHRKSRAHIHTSKKR